MGKLIQNCFCCTLAEKILSVFLIFFIWFLAPIFCYSETTSEDLTALFSAAKNGDLVAVQTLVRNNPNIVEARDGYQQTALHHAAGEGHLEIVKFLLKSGADPNAKDSINFTPLHYASGFNHNDVVAVLKTAMNSEGEALQAIDQVKKMQNIVTAVGHISQGDRQGAFQSLQTIQNSGSQATSDNSLVAAIQNGKLEQVKKLLESGVDVNQRFEYIFSWLISSNEKVTSLEVAAQYENAKIIELLLKNGADVNASDGDGYTALMIAANQGQTENLQVLLRYGAKVNERAWAGGFTALSLAAARNHPACVQVLLAAGADKSIKDNLGRTPLERAEFWGHQEVIRLLSP